MPALFGVARLLAQESPEDAMVKNNPALLIVVGVAAVLLVVGILVARRLDRGGGTRAKR